MTTASGAATSKTCARCHRELPAEAFDRFLMRGKYYLRGSCKECGREAARRWYAERGWVARRERYEREKPPQSPTMPKAEATTKVCAKCGESKSITEFHRLAKSGDGRSYQCVACRKATGEAYRRRNNRAPRVKLSPEERHFKALAHQAATQARSRGVLVPPDACERCGATDSFLDMHHEDYSRRFDVKWLCKACHRQTHYEINHAVMRDVP